MDEVARWFPEEFTTANDHGLEQTAGYDVGDEAGHREDDE